MNGYTGILNANGYEVIVRDNNSLTIGEYYCEQARSTIFKFSGDAAVKPGRVTLGAARLHAWKDMKVCMDIKNYSGQISYLHGHITKDNSPEYYEVKQNDKGSVNLLFAANSHDYFRFKINKQSKKHILFNGQKSTEKSYSSAVLLNAINDFRKLSEVALERYIK